MKRLTLVVSIIFISLILTGIGYAEINPETCVGMWLFDEGDGDVAKDSSGTGNDGTINGGPQWVDGKFNSTALEFDGVDDYVDCGNDASLKPQQLTVTLWFNTKQIAAMSVMFKAGKNWNDMAGALVKIDPGGKLVGGIPQGAGNSAVWLTNPGLETEKWYHVALTIDGTNSILYLDGANIASDATGEIFYDDRPIAIGSEGGTTNPFDGFIDEVALFNEALTEEDINTIMTEGLKSAIVSAVSSSGKVAITWGRIKY